MRRYQYWPVLCLTISAMLIAEARCQNSRPSGAITPALASHQLDLAGRGREFLLNEARSNDYFLLGELHGDNEIPALIRTLWPAMWQSGYRHAAAEVSPWTAHAL